MSKSRQEKSKRLTSRPEAKGTSKWFDLLFLVVATLAITAVFLVLAQLAFAA